ncbi:hypothetical protein FHR70_001183 [Microvirga lupini]|uniref:Uncharacterized protein n=1 Tax=Microvirga lupini TaxID=420324 RepID=A0A7W4YWN5_9HYPH|nr:hypothetical protein [Microvirga lupini]
MISLFMQHRHVNHVSAILTGLVDAVTDHVVDDFEIRD